MTKEKHLQDILFNGIPLTRHLKLEVKKYDQNSLIIHAPLTPNKNDKGTAFAGSLYSVGALTGWGFLRLKLLDENIDAKVVISNGNIFYKKAMQDDFYSICFVRDNEELEKFVKRIKKKGNSKIKVLIKLYSFNNKDMDQPEAYLEAEYFGWIEKDYY